MQIADSLSPLRFKEPVSRPKQVVYWDPIKLALHHGPTDLEFADS